MSGDRGSVVAEARRRNLPPLDRPPGASIDPDKVARQFSRHAPTYDRYAVVQGGMAERVASLAEARAPRARNVLEVGCGTGRLTSRLLAALPAAQITAVDIADGMIEVAADRLAGYGSRVELVRADIERMRLESASYDLVVSSAAIQWLARPEATLAVLAEALRPGGSMLHATFGPGTFAELQVAFGEVEREHGLPLDLHTLPLRAAGSWLSLLRSSALVEADCAEAWHQSDYRDCRSLLAAIKRTGASYGPALGARRARLLPEVIERYDETFRSKAGVYATYHLLYLWTACAAG